jgi:A/G-specific adenine glycosylase
VRVLSSHFPALQFRQNLLSWYDREARDLPWRETRDPYRIWLSEIMLQQTRVAAVIEHYHEFLRRFPTVEKLARARESSVLAAWSGLGYYRRARMMHATAKQIARDGKLPGTSEELRNLPGIGRYTAAAIASIAFNEPAAVVDGNVERVLQRLSGRVLSLQDCWITATELLDSTRPGDFNQAMMELGAVICTPRRPGCLTCPVVGWCATRAELPSPFKPVPQKKKEIHFALHSRGGEVLLVQRALTASLMPGMWELPEMRINGLGAGKQTAPRLAKFQNDKPLYKLRHAITVTDFSVSVWRGCRKPASAKWIPVTRLKQVPLTGLARKILRQAEML